MKNNVHYSKESLRDMDNIWDYIVHELQNPSAAKRVVNKIMEAVHQLEIFPEMDPSLSAIADEISDYRFLVSENYMIFYRLHGVDVYIDRVLYGRRDYLRILFGNTSDGDTEE